MFKFSNFQCMRNQFKFHIYYTNFVRNCCSSLHSSIFYSRCAYQDKPLFIANGGCWAKIFSSFSFVFSETNGILLSRARYECVSFSRIIRFSVYFFVIFPSLDLWWNHSSVFGIVYFTYPKKASLFLFSFGKIYLNSADPFSKIDWVLFKKNWWKQNVFYTKCLD